jgi:hypothetical protein
VRKCDVISGADADLLERRATRLRVSSAPATQVGGSSASADGTPTDAAAAVAQIVAGVASLIATIGAAAQPAGAGSLV